MKIVPAANFHLLPPLATAEFSIVAAKWNAEQASLATQVEVSDDVPWVLPPPFAETASNSSAAKAPTTASSSPSALKLVAGVDLTPVFPQFQLLLPEPAVASIVIVELPSLREVCSADLEVQLNVPYRPGYLGFREVPAFQTLLKQASEQGFHPQLVLVDGFGVMHPRWCGSASHLGVVTGLPTIGVAKNILHVEGVVETKDFERINQEATISSTRCKSRTGLPSCVTSVFTTVHDGKSVAAAVCPAGSVRPVFVSPGHRVSLQTAIRVVLSCCKYRNPQPIRLADQRSRAAARRRLAGTEQHQTTIT